MPRILTVLFWLMLIVTWIQLTHRWFIDFEIFTILNLEHFIFTNAEYKESRCGGMRGGKVIEKAMLCDNRTDCDDGWDEKVENCKKGL